MDIINVNYIFYVNVMLQHLLNGIHVKKCGKHYQVDLSDYVDKNSNITNEIKDIIWKYYAIVMISIINTQLILKLIHKINISYQTIEDILKKK